MLKLSLGLFVAVAIFHLAASAQVASPLRAQATKELPVVARMMAYGKKQEGKVSRDEVTDERLLKLFDLADTKKEGVVTKEQVLAAAQKIEAEQPQGGRRANADGGGPGGGGRGGFGGRPQIGVVMSKFVQDELNLSDVQKQQFAELQKEVDSKVDTILNDDQKKKYKELQENAGRGGPNGRGPGGGRGGPSADGPQNP